MLNKSNIRRWSSRQVRSAGTPSNAWRIGSVIVAIVIVLLIAARGTAQDTDVTFNCTPEEMADVTAALPTTHEQMTAHAEAADTDAWLQDMRTLRTYLAVMDAFCRGFSFSSETDGLKPVIGPVMFPDGIWKATFTTAGYGQVEFTALSGDCDDRNTRLLFNESEGEATGGAGVVFTTSGFCSALMTFDNISADTWTLTFELVKTGE